MFWVLRNLVYRLYTRCVGEFATACKIIVILALYRSPLLNSDSGNLLKKFNVYKYYVLVQIP